MVPKESLLGPPGAPKIALRQPGSSLELAGGGPAAFEKHQKSFSFYTGLEHRGFQGAPRGAQEGPKRPPERAGEGAKNGPKFGPENCQKREPKGAQKGPQNDPKKHLSNNSRVHKLDLAPPGRSPAPFEKHQKA